MVTHSLDAGMAHLTNDQIKDELANIVEILKRTEEAKKEDSELARLKESLKVLEETKYNHKIRQLKKKFKAIRRLAAIRDIPFDLIVEEND